MTFTKKQEELYRKIEGLYKSKKQFKMKVLTVKQPWEYLICSGIKDIENRTRKTNFRGRVLIHAGQDNKLMNVPPSTFLTGEQIEQMENEKIRFSKYDWKLYSCIIGSVEIVDCVINHPSIWAEKCIRCNDCKWRCKHCKNIIYNWVLANPVLFEKPILNVKGELGFWDFDIDFEQIPQENKDVLLPDTCLSFIQRRFTKKS